MPTASTRYPVTPRETVLVDVIIGDGQTGGSAVFLGKDLKATGPELRGVELGKGSAVKGKVLVVSTTVVDIRSEHDRTSVQVTLRGGHPNEFPIVQSATTIPGGAVNYLTVVTFV